MDLNISFWIAQIFGLIGAIVNIISMQINNKKKILICYAFSNFSYSVNFFLLGANTGAILCFLQGIETIVNGVLSNKNIAIPKWLTIVYLILAIIFGSLTFSNLIDMLPIIGGIIYVLIIIMSKEAKIRKLTFVSMMVWSIYDFVVKSYVAGVNDLLMLLSTAIGIFRFDIKGKNRVNKKEEQKNEV